MKQSIFNIGLILLLLFVFIIGCDKDNPTGPEQLTLIGVVITRGGVTQVSYSGEESVTGELEVAEAALSAGFEIHFIDSDQSVITPSATRYSLKWEIFAAEVCAIYQHEGEEGGFEFHLDARGKEHGHTTLVFKLMEGTTTIFTSKSVPVHVTEREAEMSAWIWGYAGVASSLRVYNSATGEEKAQFTASAQPMMHMVHAGPKDAPTIWMANGGMAYSFTAGFHAHGDHAHLETPEVYKTVAVGNTPVHIGVAPDGMTVAFSNDADQSVSVIDVATGAVQTVTHGSGHSAALLTGAYLITTAATSTEEKWAKMIDISNNSVVAQIETAKGAHGDAFYATGNTAFIACGDGIYILDVAGKSLKKRLPYTQTGRTNFLYHGENASLAVGLHKTDAGTSDKILLLDLANESLEYLTIPGATLDWKIQNGFFGLAPNGQVAVLADLVTPNVYHINLQTKAVTTLTAPAASVAVGVNYDGTQVWVLDKTALKVQRIHVEHNESAGQFSVAAGTEWIFVTSYHGTVIAD